MVKTTQEHFEYFKYICLRWFKLFELADWDIYFKHGEAEGNLALIKFNLQSYLISCHFCDEWNDALKPLSQEEIFKVAKHELIHNLLAEMSELGSSRYVTQERFEAAEEALVNKLNRLIPDSLVEDISEIEVEFENDNGENGSGA